jgi:hypothetical protein
MSSKLTAAKDGMSKPFRKFFLHTSSTGDFFSDFECIIAG